MADPTPTPAPVAPANALFAPTGTHSDALEARGTMADYGNRADVLKAWIRTTTLGTMDNAETHHGILSTAVSNPSAGLVWIAPDIVGHIEASSANVPEPDSFADLGLARFGMVMFGTPVQDQAANPDHDCPWATGLTWGMVKENTTGADLMFVFPWFVTDHTANHDGGTGDLDGRGTPEFAAKAAAQFGPLHPALPTFFEVGTPRSFPSTELYADGWEGPQARWARLLVAISGWCHSVADVEDVDADRTTQKRTKRTGAPINPVRVVKMRRVERPETEQGEAGEAGEGRYSHRWPVTGHWRSTPCGPEFSRRRPVYIALHIKGPDDKPLILKDRIWKVDR